MTGIHDGIQIVLVLGVMTNALERNIFGEDVGTDGEFNRDYVRQVSGAAWDLISEMQKAAGANSPKDLYDGVKLNRNSISKAKLSEWLGHFVCLMDHYTIRLLDFAAEQKDDREILKQKRIENQEKIIELQEKLIEQRDSELKSLQSTVETEMKSVQSTVQSELKSYSSVLQKKCSEALAPRKIAAAVHSVKNKEDRSANLVVFGVAEEEDEELEPKVQEILEHLNEKPRISAVRRIGRKKPGLHRPIRLSVESSSIAFGILTKSKELRNIDDCKSVYLSPDRTVEEQVTRKKLVEQLKLKRTSDPQNQYYIRKGEITCVCKN